MLPLTKFNFQSIGECFINVLQIVNKWELPLVAPLLTCSCFQVYINGHWTIKVYVKVHDVTQSLIQTELGTLKYEITTTKIKQHQQK